MIDKGVIQKQTVTKGNLCTKEEFIVYCTFCPKQTLVITSIHKISKLNIMISKKEIIACVLINMTECFKTYHVNGIPRFCLEQTHTLATFGPLQCNTRPTRQDVCGECD